MSSKRWLFEMTWLKHPLSLAPSEWPASCGFIMRCAIRESKAWPTAGYDKQGLQSVMWLILHSVRLAIVWCVIKAHFTQSGLPRLNWSMALFREGTHVWTCNPQRSQSNAWLFYGYHRRWEINAPFSSAVVCLTVAFSLHLQVHFAVPPLCGHEFIHTLLERHIPQSPVCSEVDHHSLWLNDFPKLQALVYDVRPSTTAVFSYAIGSRKQSANEQFFVGAQTVVSLLQTAQIKQGMSFIAANKVYTSTSKTTIVWIETELFIIIFTRVGCVSCLRACFGARLLLQSLILVPEPFGGRWPRRCMDSCAEIKSAPSVA